MQSLQEMWKGGSQKGIVPKLIEADHVGNDSAANETPIVEKCCVCGFEGEEVRRCGHCKATSYCSVGCQMNHHDHHKVYCSMITSLENLEREKLYRGFSVRQCQVDFRTKKKLVRLVGEKPVVSCNLGAKRTGVTCLWDTGSMVSLVDRKWLLKNYPEAGVQSIAEFLGEKLEVKAANSTPIELDGVVILDFSLGAGGETVQVPFLVTSQDLVEPILGYNVIEHFVLEGGVAQRELLGKSLGCHGKIVSVDALAAVIEEKAVNHDFLAEVKSPQNITVAAGCRVKVKCRVKAHTDEKEQSVYFAPLLSPDDSEDCLVFTETVSKLRKGHTNHVVVDVMNLSGETKVLILLLLPLLVRGRKSSGIFLILTKKSRRSWRKCYRGVRVYFRRMKVTLERSRTLRCPLIWLTIFRLMRLTEKYHPICMRK